MNGQNLTKNFFRQLIQSQEQEPFSAFFGAAILNNKPVALWKLPNHQTKHLIIDLETKERSPIADLEYLPEGFMFSPFNLNANPIFIQADIKISSDKNDVFFNPIMDVNKISFNYEPNIESGSKYFLPAKSIEISDISREMYIQMVELAKDAISGGIFQKVVPARTKSIKLSRQFDAVDLFHRLCENYPRTFVSLISVPGTGTWIGASPELLININENSFTTASLAGTQRYHPEDKPEDLPWTQKEIEEQAMVSRFIINCFKTIRLREFEEIGPRTVIAGNLAHLKTTFEVDMKATNFQDLGSVMLKLLHPTSAVCGLPKEPSYEFIMKHENFNREFFSGYLGPVNTDQQTSIFVNLRCMQLFKDFGITYSGAGVTAYSIPEKEWEETELKCATLIDQLT